MKKLFLILALAAGTVAVTTQASQAQVSVSCNIGRQPMWGPTGYDNADYYYMPDIDAYYSVNNNQFVCQQNGQWGYYNSLPGQYSNYDLYNGYKVVINGGVNPWMRNSYYRNRYSGYRGRRNQPFIRDSRDYRYYENASHPYHNQWRGAGYGGGGYRGGGYNNGYSGRGGYGGRRGGNYYSDNNRGYDRGNQGSDNRRYGGGQRYEDRQQGSGNGGRWEGRDNRQDSRQDNRGNDRVGGGDRGDRRGGENRGGDNGGGWRGGRR